MKSLRVLSIVVATGALFLTGCATTGQNSNYGQNQPVYRQSSQSVPAYNNTYNQQVRYGTVYSVRQVQMSAPQTSGVGVGVGAVAGGLIGNQIGKGNGRTAATILGAVGGGFLGNEVEKLNYGPTTGVEVQVKLDRTGEMVTVVQADQGQNFRNGSRVKLVQDQGNWVVSY